MLEGEIRILHLIPDLRLAGMEKVTYNLVKKLNKSKFVPIVCCLDTLEVLGEELKDLGFKIYSLGRKPGKDFFLIFKIAKVIRQERIDIVHAHNTTAWFYGLLAAKLSRVPIIVTRHGLEERNKWKITILSKVLSLFTLKIISVSNELKEYSKAIEKINKGKTSVIWNGIDVEKFQNVKYNIEAIKRGLQLNLNDRFIGTISNVSQVKNHKFIIKAMPKLLQKLPNLKLIIVGSVVNDLFFVELKALCENLKVSESVIFLGSRKDVAELMSIFDVFVLCSLSEGISLTLLEAMAAGKPIVATNVGGNPEVIENGKTGTLISPEKIDEYVSAVHDLLTDKESVNVMKKNSIERVQKFFSLEKMVSHYENLYLDIMAVVYKRKYEKSAFFNCLFLRFKIFYIKFCLGVKMIGSTNKKFSILNYHRILPKDSLEYNSYVLRGMLVSLENFDEQMKAISKSFEVISLYELITRLKNKYLFKKHAIVVTFDDGYYDNYFYAYPVLKKYNISATIFLATNFISTKQMLWWDELVYIISHTNKKLSNAELPPNLYPQAIKRLLLLAGCATLFKKANILRRLIAEFKTLSDKNLSLIMQDLKEKLCFPSILENDDKLMLTWEELREMSKDNIDFGAHTTSHYNLLSLSKKEAEEEILNSKRHIEKEIGKPVYSFAYPYGDINEEVNDIVYQTGYKCGVFSGELNEVYNNKTDTLYLKRKSISDPRNLKILQKLYISYFINRLKL